MIRCIGSPSHDEREDAATWRARRVATLLVTVVGLSIADLALTIGHIRTVGMFEVNPIALHVIRMSGSATGLGMYKALTVLVSVALLYRLRRFPQAELGAWLAVGLLAFVSTAWVRYVAAAEDLPALTTATPTTTDPQWVAPDTIG